MIFNRDFLFIHVPKTGGMAMTEFLLKVLPKPVYYSHPHAHNASLASQGIIEIPGDRHETAAMCRKTMAQHGVDIAKVGLIVAVVRNPYEMEVSRFAYLQNGHEWDSGENQELAVNGDFEAFAWHSEDHGGSERPIQSYFELNGAVPKNLCVLHQENLAAELQVALQRIGINVEVNLPRVNTTRHGDLREYYTAGAEEAVYQRYSWIFNHGYYPRLNAKNFPFAAPGPRFTDPLNLTGPAQRVGLAHTCWGDTWVGPRLTFPVRITGPVRGVLLSGWTPRHTSAPLDLRVRLGNREFQRSLPGDKAFKWEIPCPLARHEAIEVELSGSPVFKPCDVIKDSRDNRELTFRLQQFEFQPADQP